jgi:hypothetical protein
VDEERFLRELSRKAGLESPPRVQIVEKVMAAVRAAQPEAPLADQVLGWIAAASAAAALPLAGAALVNLLKWADPLVGFFMDLTLTKI